MTRGKIVLVPFPFDDLSTAKVRPAVCLTEPTGPQRHVVLAFSTIRLHRLLTISTSLIRRELGRLPNSVQNEVDEKLRTLLRLS